MEGVLKQVMDRVLINTENIRDEEVEARRIIEQMDELKVNIRSAESTFRDVTDDDLIEATIYEIASLKARYSYLIRLAKEKAIVCPS